MKYIKTAVLFVLLLLLQTTFCKMFLGHTAPNLLLCAAICYALRENDFLHSAYFGIVCGVLLDYTSGNLFGVATLLCTALSATVTLISPQVFKAKLAACVLFLFVGSLVYEFLYYVLCYGLWHHAAYWKVLLGNVLPSAIYSVIGGVLMMPWVRRIAADFEEGKGNR